MTDGPVRMPDDDSFETPDIWDAGGQYDSDKARIIAAEIANWHPAKQTAVLNYLRAAEVRARVRATYAHPAEIGLAVDPDFTMTPTVELTSRAIEQVLISPKPINLAISEPPQEGKSTLAAVYGSIRALQHNPDFHIILTTYGNDLAHRHSREIRSLIATHGSGVVDTLTGLPVEDKLGLRLQQGSNRVDAWSVEGGKGGLIAVGLGAATTGVRADLVIIDDPFKNMMEADSKTHRDRVDEWFSSVARTRLAPAASIILIQCMTGDTPVMRPDGTETPLADIRPGDEIVTYENGALTTSTVRNWASQGLDDVLCIRMMSGRTVRANARHPFLTSKDGVETWQTAGTITSGVRLVGLASSCALDTESITMSTTPCLHHREVGAPSADDCPTTAPCPSTGMGTFASTTATTATRCADCCATTATSCSDGVERQTVCAPGPTISTDTVVSVEPCGVAEVFDIEVDRTENFIANGLISHNTRWHPEDLMGKVLAAERSLPKSERTWKHINIPAIAEEGIKDSLKRPYGEPMISARDTPEAKRDFRKTRRDVGERTWYALYQGSPRNPTGGLFSRDDFEAHRLPDVPVHPLASVVGVDPADSGEGDEAGIIGGMLMQNGHVALTHDRSGKYTSDQWSREAVLLALELGSREIAVEAYTTSTTYVQVVKRAYSTIHAEARRKQIAGAELSPVEMRALSEVPPFLITKWRGASKADAVARSSLIRQAFENGRAHTVEGRLAVFEDQAADWQDGQHQPDRVAAGVIAYDKLSTMGGGTQIASPVNRTTPPPPPWMRRRLGK